MPGPYLIAKIAIFWGARCRCALLPPGGLPRPPLRHVVMAQITMIPNEGGVHVPASGGSLGLVAVGAGFCVRIETPVDRGKGIRHGS